MSNIGGGAVPTLAALCTALGLNLVPVTDVPLPDKEVSGVHVSELTDPTPYLQGGELLLTTGMGLTGHVAQARAYTARLARHGVVALGLGLGPIHAEVPRTLLVACEAAGLTLFAVPAPTPFLMVARTYWELLAQAGHEELSSALGAHRDLVRAAGGPAPVPAVVRTLAAAVEGWAAHLSADGQVLEVWPRASAASARAAADQMSALRTAGPHSSATFPIEGDDVVLQPLSTRGRLTGYVATGCARPMRAEDQQLVLAACSLLALQSEQHRRGVVGPRSSRACVVRLVTTGYVDAARSLAGELGLEALPSSVWILAVADLGGGGGDDLQDTVEAALPRQRSQVLASGGSDDLWVLLSGGDLDAVCKVVRGFVTSQAAGARAVVSPLTRLSQVARQVGLMQSALGAVRPGEFRDLSLPDPAVLGPDKVDLGPLVDYARADLVGSVVVYLRHRGHWQDAARELGVHRNTLRHRIGTASHVIGANLNDPDVAARLWLALRTAGLA
jgi:purine catabolism regulator